MQKLNRVIRDERMKTRFFFAIYINEIYLFSFVRVLFEKMKFISKYSCLLLLLYPLILVFFSQKYYWFALSLRAIPPRRQDLVQ